MAVFVVSVYVQPFVASSGTLVGLPEASSTETATLVRFAGTPVSWIVQ